MDEIKQTPSQMTGKRRPIWLFALFLAILWIAYEKSNIVIENKAMVIVLLFILGYFYFRKKSIKKNKIL
jgi:hypothetical protein